jgi:hypothetical protein
MGTMSPGPEGVLDFLPGGWARARRRGGLGLGHPVALRESVTIDPGQIVVGPLTSRPRCLSTTSMPPAKTQPNEERKPNPSGSRGAVLALPLTALGSATGPHRNRRPSWLTAAGERHQ